MNLPHLPALRRGKPYESLDKIEVVDHRTGQSMATVSQVNAGIIRKDLAKIGEARAALKKFSVAQLIEIFEWLAGRTLREVFNDYRVL